MNKLNFRAAAKSVRLAMEKYSPELLTGIGIAGMVTTTVMAVRATPKAMRLIKDREQEEGVSFSDLSLIEKVKTAGGCYIPSVITGSLSVLCLIGANSVNAKRKAALATAYSLSETALKKYQEKVIETVGEKKEQAVRDAVARDEIEHNPVSAKEVVFTGKGDTLCYDAISGRYFKSDIDAIKRAENRINKALLEDSYVSLNDFYYEIGLGSIKLGDDLGWQVEKGLVELDFRSHLAEDGTPCLVIDYRAAPKYDYNAAYGSLMLHSAMRR